MRTPATTMVPVNLDIQTKIIAVFVFLDSTVKTVKEVGVWGWSNYSYLFTVTVSQRLQTNNTKTSLLAYGGVKTRLQSEPWENWPSEYWKQPLLKADTHEGFCSQSMLKGHAPGAKLLRVYQRFHGYTSSSGAEFPPRKMLHDI